MELESAGGFGNEGKLFGEVDLETLIYIEAKIRRKSTTTLTRRRQCGSYATRNLLFIWDNAGRIRPVTFLSLFIKRFRFNVEFFVLYITLRSQIAYNSLGET